MTKIVQLNRHGAEEAADYTGPEGELTAEMSNKELRLHDGETPGGHRFLSRDSNDQRYQARSVELDGLTGWEPNERGWLVRLGPSTYRLRKITVNGANLTVSNPTGYGGNPLISLADEITSAHTWTGVQTYAEEIQADGGIRGDVVGDITGNLTGNVTGNLEGNANGDHTGTFTGSVDVSEGEIIFADGQIPLAALSQEAIDYIIRAGLPIGSIVPFHGQADTIPENWFLCDGSNDTPDLRGRFILGSDHLGAGASGGSDLQSVNIVIAESGAHVHEGETDGHALTVAEMPAHKHANGVTDSGNKVLNRGTTPADPVAPDSIDNNGNNGTLEGWTSTVGQGQEHSHAMPTDPSGAHTHEIESADDIDLMPPFYALAYIMKGA